MDFHALRDGGVRSIDWTWVTAVLPRAARAGLLRGVVTGTKVVVLTGARVTKPRKVGTRITPPKARIGETILGKILGKKVNKHHIN